MSQAHASSRFISVAVIVALVAVTVLMTCGVAFGAPMNGGAPDSGTCGVDSHGSMGAAVSAEAPKIAMSLYVVVPFQVHLDVPQTTIHHSAPLSAELPPPTDPRHGRIRV